MRRSVLTEIEKAAADLAYRDDLTGLLNRRLLSAVIEPRWGEIVEATGRVAVLMIDLDGFKAVNDVHGHLAGDAVLRATGHVLRDSFRGDDVVVRYGGDEFLVLLPGASAADAARLGERARQAMESLREVAGVRDAVAGTPVSFSIGAAALPDDGGTLAQLLAAADRRLFADKRGRRPRRPLRAAWAAVAAVALAAAATIAVLGFGRRVPPRDESGPVATGAAGAAREVELLEEIARLRRELVTRQGPERTPADAESERREVERLQRTIGELEEELRRRAADTAVPTAFLAAEPVPQAPPATPAPTPAPTATATGGAPVPPLQGPDAAPRPRVARSAGPTVTVPPVLRRSEPPRYPEIAERLRREAAVEVRVWVGADGRVSRVEPVGPPVGYGFDEAALEAARRAVFVPGTVDGRPVQMETTLTIRFTLSAGR